MSEPRTAPPGTAEVTDVLCAFVERLINDVDTHLLRTVAETELSHSQLQTLAVLRSSGQALPIHRLAELLGISVAAAGRGVDKLFRLGFVDRREDEHDRRIKRVSLTGAGRQLLADNLEAVNDRIRQFVARLPDALRSQLNQALGEVLLGNYLEPTPAHQAAAPLSSRGSP